MGTKSKGRTPEAQEALPGMEEEVLKIPAVTRALKRLKLAKQEYQKAGLDAKEANETALALFHEHQITNYKTPWGWVTLENKEKLKFSEKADDPEPVDGEDVTED